jgi:hypothetical protein
MYHFELTPGPRVPRGAEPELSYLSCVWRIVLLSKGGCRLAFRGSNEDHASSQAGG